MQVAAHMCRRLLLRHAGISVYAVGLCWMPVLFSSVWFIVVLRSSENSTCKLKHGDKYVRKYTRISLYGHASALITRLMVALGLVMLVSAFGKRTELIERWSDSGD